MPTVSLRSASEVSAPPSRSVAREHHSRPSSSVWGSEGHPYDNEPITRQSTSDPAVAPTRAPQPRLQSQSWPIFMSHQSQTQAGVIVRGSQGGAAKKVKFNKQLDFAPLSDSSDSDSEVEESEEVREKLDGENQNEEIDQERAELKRKAINRRDQLKREKVGSCFSSTPMGFEPFHDFPISSATFSQHLFCAIQRIRSLLDSTDDSSDSRTTCSLCWSDRCRILRSLREED